MGSHGPSLTNKLYNTRTCSIISVAPLMCSAHHERNAEHVLMIPVDRCKQVTITIVSYLSEVNNSEKKLPVSGICHLLDVPSTF